MRTLTISNAQLMRFALIAAGVALLVAPFRASAGLRGAMLLLAGAAILFAHFRADQLKQLLPTEKLLGAAVAIWLASASIWAAMGPSPIDSLSVVKRDILTSMLAFFVFYALTRTRTDMLRWIYVLTAGLVLLAGTVALEPAEPRAFGPARAYVDVGWLATWLVTVAPMLAVLMFPPRAQRRAATTLLMLGLPCLLWLAWLTGNRVVWVCFATTVVINAGIVRYAHKGMRDHLQATVIVAGLLALIALLMIASMQFRAEAESPGGAGAVASMFQDGRAQIWRVAWSMIGERPLLGYGYGDPEFPDLFAAHFEPEWRHLFRHAHNIVLNYMLQMGVIGGAVVLFLFAALAWTLAVRAKLGALARLGGYCGIALLVAVILRNSTDDFFSRHAVQFFGAFIGMLLGLATRRPPLSAGMAGHSG